jgi:ATP adenylyltransferase
MTFDRLWAPWRLEYVSGGESDAGPQPEPSEWRPGADRECFLCRAAASYENATDVDRRLLVAGRGPLAQIVLNRYPYNNGHVLVAPCRHVGELSDVTQDEHVE